MQHHRKQYGGMENERYLNYASCKMNQVCDVTHSVHLLGVYNLLKRQTHAFWFYECNFII